MPAAISALVIDGGVPRVSASTLLLLPTLFVAVIVMLKVPAEEGVPPMVWLEALKVSPAGRLVAL